MNSRSYYSDIDYVRANEQKDAILINIDSSGCRLFGYLHKPGNWNRKPSPCVLMFDDFPRHTLRNETEFALTRMGFVVLHMNYRGVWGSSGTFLLSALPADVRAAAEWIYCRENALKFAVDRENIYMAGHGIGGMAVLNAAEQLPYIHGVAAVAPFDLEVCFRNGMERELMGMLEQNRSCLRMTSVQSVYEDAIQNSAQLGLLNAAKHLKDRNVLLVGGVFDRIAPPAVMLRPVVKKIRSLNGSGTCKDMFLNTNHGLCGQSAVLGQILKKWIEDTAVCP